MDSITRAHNAPLMKRIISTFLFAALVATSASAANLYWVGTTPGATVGSPSGGNWSTATTAWDNSTGDGGNPADSAYVNGSVAIFGGTGAYTATLTAALSGANNIQFNSGTPTVAGAFTIPVQNTLSVLIASGVTGSVVSATIDVNGGSYSVGQSGSTPGGTLSIGSSAKVLSSNSGFGVGIDGNGTLVDVKTGGMFGNSSSGSGTMSCTVGPNVGANSTLQVSGGTVSVGGNNHTITVGGNGAGTLILNSGSVTMPAATTKNFVLASGSGSFGTNNLNGGTMSVLAVAKGSGTAVFNFNGGTLRANANNANFMTGLDVANVRNGGATINNFGKSITIAQALLHSGISGDNATDGGLTSTGTGGTVTLTGANTYNGPTLASQGTLVTTTASIGGGTYTVANGATLMVQVNLPGTSLTNSSLTLGTTTAALNLNFALGVNASATIPAIVDTGLLTLNGAVTVNVTASGLTGNSTNLLMTYGSLGGTGSFVPGTFPTVVGYAGILINDTVNKQLKLIYIQPPQPVQWAVANGNWDTTSLNWQPLGGGSPTNYTENSFVLFDDNASGSSPIAVTLTADHTPTVISNNASKSYILAGGSFGLTGASLVKDGAGALILDNGAGNSFVSVSINNGTLQVGNGDSNGSLGPSAVTDNGILAFNRTDTSLSVANAISGSGGISQNGSGTVTLTSANTYSGQTTINNGQLVLGNSSAALNSTVRNNVNGGLGFASSLTAATIAGLAGTNDITLTNAAATPVTLSVSSTNFGSIFGGSLKGGTLIKQGTNTTLTLTNFSALNNVAIGNGVVGGSVVVSNSALIVGDGTANSSVQIAVGGNTSATYGGTLDVSASSSFTANVGNFFVFYGTGGSPVSSTASVALGTNNNIIALNEFKVGQHDNQPTTQGSVTTAAHGVTTIATPVMNVGVNKARGFFTLGTGATLNLSGTNAGRAALAIENQGASTGNNITAVFDATGGGTGIFNAALSSLLIGNLNVVNNAGTATGSLLLSSSASNHLDVNGAGDVVVVGKCAGGSGAGVGSGTLTIGNLDATSAITSVDNGNGILIGTGGKSVGVVNLNGGTLTITTAGSAIAGGSGTSTLNLNGATLKAGADSATFIQNLSSASILSNGITFDTAGFSIAIPQSLQDGGGGGGLSKIGGGVLYLNGANGYTGTTLVNSGAVGGVGSIAGSVTVAPNAALAPGDGLGTLIIYGDLNLNGNLWIEVDKSAFPASDTCFVGGALTNGGGGFISVTNLNEGLPLAENDSFTLFNQPVLNGGALMIIPAPGPGLGWTNRLAIDGSIAVISQPVVNQPPISYAVNGNTLSLSWPGSYLGWTVQSNSVSISASNSWFDVAGSQAATNLNVTINASLPKVFYRLRQ